MKRFLVGWVACSAVFLLGWLLGIHPTLAEVCLVTVACGVVRITEARR
jgi:hypothetical protein